jgi:predicted dithiol-disulfide oxidoreductase (DUF899 family)
MSSTANHKIVSEAQWVEARRALLAKEKELTRQHDEIARERRELPWVKVTKNYTFDTPQGKRTLDELFAGHSQLLVYHFMFGPDWNEGCPSCSYVSDHLNGAVPHLAARDVTLTMVSRAPIEKIQAFRQRMGWQFPWVSSFNTDFNYDYHASFTPQQRVQGKVDYNYTMQEFPSEEAPGASVFYKDNTTGDIFHTYSTYGRGLDALVTSYTLLDMVPKARDEEGLPFDMAWVRHHDRYETGKLADADRPYWPKIMADLAKGESSCCGKHEAHT